MTHLSRNCCFDIFQLLLLRMNVDILKKFHVFGLKSLYLDLKIGAKNLFIFEMYMRDICHVPIFYELIMFVQSWDIRKSWLRWPWEWYTMYCSNVEVLSAHKNALFSSIYISSYLHRKCRSCISFCIKPCSIFSSLFRNQKINNSFSAIVCSAYM